MVYSAYDVHAGYLNRDPRNPVHSDYKILAADGKLLRTVHNDSGTIFQDPARVDLPAGQYQVVARANGYGNVTVPVVIEAHRTTMLHLDGDAAWTPGAAFNQNNAVRLPDGQIVGWKTPERTETVGQLGRVEPADDNSAHN